jgi:hypothetical protein
MLQKKHTKPLSTALAAGLMTAWLSTAPIANAESPEIDLQVEKTPATLMREVQAYSQENDGLARIGLFINIAPDTNLSPVLIGDRLVAKLEQEHGIEATYAFNYAEAGRSSVSFFVNGVPYANYGFDMIAEGYNQAVTHYKNLQQTPQLVVGLNH